MVVSDRTRITLRIVALGYLFALVVVPLGMILFRTFEDGLVAFWESVTTPASISAISLSLTIIAIVVPLNVVFGLVTALALARGRFPGRGIVQAVVDLPFAVSPVIVGVSLILLYGVGGWFGGLAESGFRIIFSLPGMVLATIFVTLPFVSGESQTLTLLVHARYIDDHNTFGAYSAATVLMGLALIALFLMTVLNKKR